MAARRRCVTVLCAVAALSVAAWSGDVEFAKGTSSLAIPFDDANRTVAVEGKVNGVPMRLVLDTGAAGSVLDEDRARSLGLKLRGSQRAQGAGGEVQGSRVSDVRVGLPGVELSDQTMTTLSLSALSARTGRPMDAILGAPLFRGMAVEIDYPRRLVSLHDAASFRYEGKGTPVPIEMIDGQPYVTARLVLPGGRAIEGRFVVDTGASTALMLTAEAVEGARVLDAVEKTIGSQALGVGGGFDVRLGRIEALELGGFTLARPVTVFRSGGPGRVSASGTLGNIGGGVLNRFKVVFDYERRRMILEAGPGLDEPFESDMSGLSLVATSPKLERIRVDLVHEGSPASEAGVRAGDVIEAVDGAAATAADMPELRHRLRREGQTVELVLRRGGETVTVTIRTRRLV